MPTLGLSSVTFFIFGFIFIPIGVVMLVFSNQIVEVKYRYDEECTVGASCDVTIEIEDKMVEPVMLYYQLDNFYQNHRNYMNSRDWYQNLGEDKSADDLGDCTEAVTNKEMGKTTDKDGGALDPDDPANPCGLAAKAFFDDTYQLLLGGTPIDIDESDIAWPGDTHIFDDPDDPKYKQWISL